MWYLFEKDYQDGVEVCYWRKHWGLRNWFLREAFPNSSNEQYYFDLDVEKITILMKIIIHYLRHPNDWDNNYWEFSEVKHVLRHQLWNLFLLRRWMKRHSEAKVVFYDSY